MTVSGGSSAELAGRVVLLVEDDEDTREVLAALIASAGGMAISLPSAHEALEALTGAKFDLVVTDYAMPGLDGLALIQRLRAIPAHAAVPVVMLSGQGNVEIRREVQSLNALFVPKPVDAERLLATLARLLDSSNAA